MLLKEKFPYLFVLLIGLFTWAFNNIVENSKKSPIVEYTFKEKSKSKTHLILKNISSSNRLNNLEFNICKINQLQPDPIINAVPPAYKHESSIKPSSITEKCFSFKISELQPNSEFRIEYKSAKSDNEVLKLINSSGQVVRVTKSNSLTFLIKNQLRLNYFVLVFSIIFLIPYTVYLKKSS